jgi:hypothetical protein
MWLGSIEIAEKKFAQKGAPVYMYMFTHESNLIVPGGCASWLLAFGSLVAWGMPV